MSATAATPTVEVIFPTECRGEPLPAEQPPPTATVGDLPERLRVDDAVAWSPDGDRLAFRGGRCEAVYDDCLSIGTVSTGTPRTRG